MSRVKLHVYLSCNDELLINLNLFGILDNNCIKYNDDIVNIFFMDNLVLERECSDYCLKLDFLNSISRYIYDGNELSMSLNIIEKIVNYNSVFIKYEIVDTGDIYCYKIDWIL